MNRYNYFVEVEIFQNLRLNLFYGLEEFQSRRYWSIFGWTPYIQIKDQSQLLQHKYSSNYHSISCGNVYAYPFTLLRVFMNGLWCLNLRSNFLITILTPTSIFPNAELNWDLFAKRGFWLLNLHFVLKCSKNQSVFLLNLLCHYFTNKTTFLKHLIYYSY